MSNVDLSALRQWVEILRHAKAKEAEIKELKDQAVEQIKSVMRPGDVGLLDGEVVIDWASFKKNQLDQKALKAEHPEIVALYTKLTDSNRFDVK